MKNSNQPDLVKKMFLAAKSIIIIFGAIIVLHGCEEAAYTPKNKDVTTQRVRPGNPSPPRYFYFTNCGGYPSAITGNFVAGAPTTATATLTYINSPGGSYPAFTSSTVNGITLSTPAGTLNTGSGSITFSAAGTPVTPGSFTLPVSIAGSIACNLPITVLNAPPSGNCVEPGAAIGSTGCVDFTYRGQLVKYSTVRAGDGKIWLQQNLGSPQVAVNSKDEGSFGHYFQWGRWDDGHQVPNSPAITGSATLQNPSHIPSGNSNFIKGTTYTAWWGTGGNASNTWSGTVVTATNGKDPCVAIGPGWHLPSATEWTNFMHAEAINDEFSAFESTLKLPLTGYRTSANAAVTVPFTTNFGHYWSNTAASNTAANVFYLDTYNTFIYGAERGYGFSCRCVKN
jgi:uncharacterized protein (TIGR02145 family)